MKKICENKECSKEFTVTKNHNGGNKTNQRFCCVPCAKRAEYLDKSTDYRWRLNKLLAAAKNRAKEKNLPFDLDKQYLIDLWLENDGCCALTGQTLDLYPWGEKGQVSPQAPSIDRIIPKLGYTKGNVRIITYHLNVALSDFGFEEFERLAKLIINGEV